MTGRSATDMLDDVSSWQILLADRAYDSNALRDAMQARGAWANIKPMPNRLGPLAFSPFLYRYRDLVERFFNKLKHYRAIATRITGVPLITSPPSNSPPLASGCAIMGPCPNLAATAHDTDQCQSATQQRERSRLRNRHSSWLRRSRYV